MVGKKELRILRRVYGDRDFTPEEVELVRLCIAQANADAKRSRIPRRDIRIGETFEKKGITYRCVLRPAISQIHVSDCCAGCDILKHSNRCEAPRCSRFDRSDGQNVWFKEVKDE